MIGFPNFRKEIEFHNAAGYHSLLGTLPAVEFEMNGLFPNAQYLQFIKEIGFGSFFGGSIFFYPLKGSQSITTKTEKLKKLGVLDQIAIGYDGTTSGCFCISTDHTNLSVIWLNWSERAPTKISVTFSEWIESLPQQLFSPDIYKSYKKIRDPKSVSSVINMRGQFEIQLLDFDKALSKLPGSDSAPLPRYNRLKLLVTKNADVNLPFYTLRCFRTNSAVGKDNIEYVSVPVSNILVGHSIELEAYLFDPFNVSFDTIILDQSKSIDLASRMKTKYKEILPYL